MNDVMITPEASETIRGMDDRCRQLAAWFGEDSDAAVQANESLRRSLAFILAWQGGPLRVMADGPLSLICSAESFCFGVNFSHKYRNDAEVEVTEMRDIGTWSVNS